jgi:uncharacterized protein
LILKELNAPERLEGGAIVDGFPGTGLASTISSACLISSMKLPLVAELRSPHFPALATVLNQRAQAPARAYADAKRKLTIFLGDFVPGQSASFDMASAIVDWAKRKQCAFIVTSYSIPIAEEGAEHDLTTVVNDDQAAERVKNAGIPLADLTAVGGTAGRLLLQGREGGIPVIALLVRAHKDLQDFEAGLKLAETLMKIIPGAECDLSSLREEAQKTEDALRKIQLHAAAPDIYR